MPTSEGVTIKAEGYLVTPSPLKPPTITAPEGISITAHGYLVSPTASEKAIITSEVHKQYPDLKPDDVVTVTYTAGDQLVTYFMNDEKPGIVHPPESVKLMGIELPKGEVKDFILSLRHALEVDESKLTGELFGIKNPELERSAAQINKFFDVFAPRVEAKMLEEPVAFIKEAAFVTATFIPILGTALTWKDNSDVGRAVNILIDIAILAPFAKAGVRNIKAKVDPFKAASKQLILQERAVSQQLAKVISRTYGKKVGSNFLALDKAQARYINQLVRLEKLKSAKRPNTAKITKANNIAESLARDLESTATKYVALLKTSKAKVRIGKYRLERVATGKFSAGGEPLFELKKQLVPKAQRGIREVSAKFDDPSLGKLIDNLPKEVVRNCKSAVEGLKPQKVNIANLKTAVARAEARLKEAQIKYPTQPSKWADLMADHAIAQSKLEQATARGMIELYDDLLKARDRLARTELPAERVRLQAEVYSLEDKVRRAIKSMEVEWGRGGLITTGRGGVATLTRVSPKAPVITGAGVRVKPTVKPTTVDAISASSLARIRGDYELKPAEIEKIEPMVTTTLAPLEKTITKSTPEVIAEVEKLTVTALQHATDLAAQNKTMAEIRAAVENELRNKIQAFTDPALRTQLLTKLKIMASTVTETAIKIKTRLKLKAKISIRIPTPSGSRLLTPEELAGSVAWKQGFIYKLIYPPYGKHNIIHSTKPFAGIKVVKGARSAYESIKRINGKLPRTIKRDMGIMDVIIVTPKHRKAKPRLKFKRDPRQRTRTTPTISTMR